MYVALPKSIHFREIFEWAFTDGVTTFVNMWLCCRQALVFWPNNFDYFTVWCLLLLCHLKRKLFKSTIMPVEVLISIVKDWYEWLVSGLVHLLSNDPFRRTGLMPCRLFLLVNSKWVTMRALSFETPFSKQSQYPISEKSCNVIVTSAPRIIWEDQSIKHISFDALFTLSFERDFF